RKRRQRHWLGMRQSVWWGVHNPLSDFWLTWFHWPWRFVSLDFRNGLGRGWPAARFRTARRSNLRRRARQIRIKVFQMNYVFTSHRNRRGRGWSRFVGGGAARIAFGSWVVPETGVEIHTVGVS